MDTSHRDLNEDFRGAIEALSNQLHVPAPEVSALYSEELERLTARARIRSFVPVLAMRNTRSILRRGCR